MFLFKRKKENSGNQAGEATKAELIRPDKSKKDKPKAKGKTVEAESVVETIETSQAEGKETPVKMVVPASALKDEAAGDPVAAAPSAPPVPAVSDEVADSLLTPGHGGDKKPADAPPAAPVEAKKPAPAPDAPKPEAKKAAPEAAGGDNLFSSLFSKTEVEEENSLDRLVKALPDITMEEVLSEAEEVKNLMKEYSHSQEG